MASDTILRVYRRCKRNGEGQRDRDRDRQTDIQIERQRGRVRETEREVGDRERQTYKQIDRQTQTEQSNQSTPWPGRVTGLGGQGLRPVEYITIA